MDVLQFLTWVLTGSVGGAMVKLGDFFVNAKKVSSEAKLTDSQVEKIQAEITIGWLKECQQRIKDLEESNELKDDHIEQLEAIIRTKRLPNPNQSDA